MILIYDAVQITQDHDGAVSEFRLASFVDRAQAHNKCVKEQERWDKYAEDDDIRFDKKFEVRVKRVYHTVEEEEAMP